MVSIDTSVVQWSAPEGARAEKPLVVLLHGVGSHEGDLSGLAPRLSPDFVYASLRAPLPFDDRPGGGAYSWYPLDTPGSPEYAPVDAAAEAVLAWVDTLAAAGTVQKRPGVLGFSQGGSLAVQLLRRRPAGIRFAVVLAGFVVPGADESVDRAVVGADPSVFYGRGTDDAVIPPSSVARTEAWFETFAPRAEVHVYDGLAHGISPSELDDVNAFLSRQ